MAGTPKRIRTIGGLLAGLAVLWLAEAASALQTFDVTEIGFGNGPAAEVTADFNADGKPDLAVANADGGTVSVYINSGTGFGSAPTQLLNPTGVNRLRQPQGIAAADFDNDNKIDIVVTNFTGNSVSFFKGTGTGTFNTTPTTTAVASRPLGIAVGKFRSTSTFMDLAVVVYSNARFNGGLSLLLGNGNGTFSVQSPIIIGGMPKRVVVGEWGSPASQAVRDANPDVAVTLFKDASVAVLYGNGTGNLCVGTGCGTGATAVKFPTSVGPQGIVAADFNDDACTDLATAQHNGSTYNGVDVLLGCDPLGGSFSNGGQVASFGGTANTTTLAALHLNTSDTKIDIAAIDTGSRGGSVNNSVKLLQNNTTSGSRSLNFAAAVTCQNAVEKQPVAIATADFNNDSKADFAVGNRRADEITIATGTGAGNPVTCPSTTTIGQAALKTPIFLATCDVTDTAGTPAPPDGKLDLLIIDQATSNIVVFGGDGTGNFTKGATNVAMPAGESTPSSVACAGNYDADLTGRNDFAVTYQGSHHARLFCNNGSGGFVPDAPPPGACPQLNASFLSSPAQIGFTNLDGLTHLDFAIPNFGSNTVWISTINANKVTGIQPNSVAFGMLTTAGSAVDDVAVSNFGSQSVSTFSNNGTGSSYVTNPAAGLGSQQPVWVSVGDLNNDGRGDLVTANKTQDKVSVLLSSGGGTFAGHIEYSAANQPNSAAVGDFDLDGKLDVAVAGFLNDKVSVLLGNGAGSLTPCATNSTSGCEFQGGNGPSSIVAADFNGDSKRDLAVVDQNTGSIMILTNSTVPAGGGGC